MEERGILALYHLLKSEIQKVVPRKKSEWRKEELTTGEAIEEACALISKPSLLDLRTRVQVDVKIKQMVISLLFVKRDKLFHLFELIIIKIFTVIKLFLSLKQILMHLKLIVQEQTSDVEGKWMNFKTGS